MDQADDTRPEADAGEDAEGPPIPPPETLRGILRERILRHYLPSRCEVLGLQLRPFTLWHWRALEVIGCPYTPDGDWQLDHAQLAAAAHLLTLPPLFAGSLSPGWLRSFLLEVKCKAIWRLGAESAGILFHEELSRLFSHVWFHYEGPAKWTEGKSVPVNAPGWLYLVGRLVAIGYPEREAWTKTPGEARCLIAAVDVAQGGSDFLSEEDLTEGLQSGHSLEDFGL